MASLRKRGKTGVYYAQWYDEDGKQVRKSLETTVLQIAKQKLRDLNEDGPRALLPKTISRTPIADIIKAFIAHKKAHNADSTNTSDFWVLGDLFGPVCDELKTPDGRCRGRAKKNFVALPPLSIKCIEDITRAEVADFIVERVMKRGIKGKSANHYREILVCLVNWAMNERDIEMPGGINPIQKLKKYPEPQRTIRYLKPRLITEQLAALEKKPLLKAMVATLIYTGLRREELLWLTHADIDLTHGPNGVIHVRAKTVGEQSWQPKTGVNRVIPISSNLRQHLDAYQPRIVPGRWYFPSPKGRRWNPDNFSQDLRDANRKAGFPWTCLDFRHTFGSTLAQRNVSLYKISKLMGNSPEICRKHYAALITESLVDAVEFGILDDDDGVVESGTGIGQRSA
jgi:integrase